MDAREMRADGITVVEVKGPILSGADDVSSAGLRVLLRVAEQVDQTKGRLVSLIFSPSARPAAKRSFSLLRDA